MAIAGFVISLVSIICCCGSLSTFSLVFSIIGLVNSKKVNGNGKGLAIAGIIISILAYVLLFIVGFGFGILGEMVDSLDNASINPGVYY